MIGSLPDPSFVMARHTVAGQLCDATPIEGVTLCNARGVSARILSFGATLQSLVAPDADGALSDIVLGHDDVAGYAQTRNFFGATVGRYANRIAGGRFELDGVMHVLDQNDGPNTLHGGAGLDQQSWSIISVTEGHRATVLLRIVSTDGASGFPGEVTATAAYSLDAGTPTRAGDLTISLAATTTRATIINLTNHAVFDLAGGRAAGGAMLQRLTIAASSYTPVDAQLIPTGERRPVRGSVFDFREGRTVAAGLRDGSDEQIVTARGYDHNFVLDKGVTDDPQPAARLDDPDSGRRLEVLTTEPGLQFYSGNSLDGRVLGKQGRLYRMGDGIALEPQRFPDTPNRPAFGSARLDPGQLYRHTMIYRLSATR